MITNFKAGGLLHRESLGAPRFALPTGVTVPYAIDNRFDASHMDDQGRTSMCFPGTSQVLMGDSTWQSIAKVRVGMSVIGDDGNPHRVTATSKRKWQGTMCTLQLTGDFNPLCCTPEHPILIIPKVISQNAKRHAVNTTPIWAPAKDIKVGDYVALIGSRRPDPCHPVLDFERDPEFQWFAGLYLAEGLISQNSEYSRSIHICLHRDETDLQMRVVDLAERYGFGTNIRYDTKTLSCVVAVHSNSWADWLEFHCGRYSHNKRLSPYLLQMDCNFYAALIGGWEDGDGHVNPKARTSVTSVSLTLARQMRLLSLRIGVWARLEYKKPHKRSGEAFNVCYGASGPSERGFWSDGLYFARVSEVTKVPQFMGENVYNLEVADVHTYVVDYSIVHNCAAYTMAADLEARDWKATGIQRHFDPAPIYQKAKEVDGNNEEGTYLTSVFIGAKMLSLLPQNATYQIISNLQELKVALHRHDYVLGGFDCIEGWNDTSTSTGFINEKATASMGGHAVWICSYEGDEWVGLKNSWGGWGYKGFGRMSTKCFDKTFITGLVVIR